jgi:hypothetical protein
MPSVRIRIRKLRFTDSRDGPDKVNVRGRIDDIALYESGEKES